MSKLSQVDSANAETGAVNLNLRRGVLPMQDWFPRPAPPTRRETDPRKQPAPLKLKCFHVHTWDLSDEKQCEEYRSTKQMLLPAKDAGYAIIAMNETKFIEHPTPRWIAHLEWYEYAHWVSGIFLSPAQNQAYIVTGIIPEEALQADVAAQAKSS